MCSSKTLKILKKCKTKNLENIIAEKMIKNLFMVAVFFYFALAISGYIYKIVSNGVICF